MSFAINSAVLATFAVASGLSAVVPSVASAAAITPGDLVIYRVGTGTGTLSSASAAVFLDEYSVTGTLVQSIAMPSTAAANNGGNLVASGSATSEGLLNVSPDGKFIALTGYDSPLGVASIAGTTSVAVNRQVGVVTVATGTTALTPLTDFATGNNPRSAITTNGTDLYVTGGAGGVRYATASATATTSTQLSTTTVNIRDVTVAGGQLYVSSSSGTTRLATVGTGTPTTSGQTITNLAGITSATPANSTSPYALAFADLSADVAGVDTMYVADDTATVGSIGGIQKFSLVAGTWTLTGNVGTAGAYRGLTIAVDGTTVNLYAVGNAANLVSLSDTSGYNGTLTGTPTVIATAAANTAFRGVGFVAVPEPAGLAVLGIAGVAALRRRRA